MKSSTNQPPRSASPAPGIADAALLAAAAAVLLVLLEWLFFVTKPSMFSVMSWSRRAAVLSTSALPVMLAAACLAAALALLARVGSAARGRSGSAGAPLGLVVPALVLTATTLLLVENFTMTVAGFNLGSIKSPLRFVYAVGLLALAAVFFRHLRRLVAGERYQHARRAAALGLAAVAVTLAVVAVLRYQPPDRSVDLAGAEDRTLANVLILSSDGLNAERMSVYGARRKTTPFLDRRADEFLVSENHVSNSALTAGSTGSLLTGKLPTTTGVTQQFRVFQGRDVYEHLPGVLRQLGYYGIEIGARHYADSHDQNLRQGFHVSNSRRLSADDVAILAWYGSRYPSERHFVASIGERIRERVAHTFGVADMTEPILAPTEQQPEWTSDKLRIAALKKEIDRAPRPFFAHVHLLDTHGPIFRVDQPHFSSGGQQQRKWDLDYLDDALRGFDRHIEDVVLHLEAIGELERTLLIINTDHGTRYDTSKRLPLLMRFPGAQPRGRIRATTQRIDVAPTILAYLGVEPPAWMEGRSLLSGEIDPMRMIFSTGWTKHEANTFVSLVQCQRWFRLHPGSGDLERSVLGGHTAPCPEEELVGEEEGRQRILALLDESPHFRVPLMLGGKLFQLREHDDPELRREIVRGFKERAAQVRYLDDEMSVAWSHWDLWTYGTSPAALLVTNRGDQPLRRRLEVHSAKNREFPFSFHIDDGDRRHEYTFEHPGSLTVELAPVAPRGERLFVVWSDTAREGVRRMVGVKLALSFSDQLEKLVRRPDAAERRRLARAILDDPAQRGWLQRDLRVANAYWDFWSRGDQPVAVVARNPGRRAAVPRVEIRSGSGREFPLRFWVEDGKNTREFVLDEPGAMTVELSPVAARSERLYLLWTDQLWSPATGDQRLLGIRLAAPTAAAL